MHVWCCIQLKALVIRTLNLKSVIHKIFIYFFFQVVDSRARTGTDGSLQAQASRQLEVFQSRAAGSSLQVVKTTTVSSSRWSGKVENPAKGLGFEDLQVFNILNVTQ